MGNQYIHYLSLLALCLELGFKNIIKITNKIFKSHKLIELFIEADKETNNKISEKYFRTNIHDNIKQDLCKILQEAEDLFEEARYCYGKSLKYFLDEKCLTNEGYIDFTKIISINKPFIMLRLLLTELTNYHDFNHSKAIKNTDIYKDFEKQLEKIINNKTLIQKNVYIAENN